MLRKCTLTDVHQTLATSKMTQQTYHVSKVKPQALSLCKIVLEKQRICLYTLGDVEFSAKSIKQVRKSPSTKGLYYEYS